MQTDCADSFGDATYIPAGWTSAPTGFYADVFRPYCRNCHMANSANFTWGPDYFSNFTGEMPGPIVCAGNSRDMPYAEVPFKAFWEDLNGPSTLALALGLPNCPSQ